MADNEIKRLIDTILSEKMNLLLSKIDKVQNQVLVDIEELKRLDDFSHYSLPRDFEVKSDSGDTQSKIDSLHIGIKNISQADNQVTLIGNLIDGLTCFCSRAAIFLIKDDKLVGWKGKGFSKYGGGITDDGIKKVFLSLSANTVFKHVLESLSFYSGTHISQPDDHLLFSRFGGESPEQIFVVPFFVKGKAQAVIYTDSFKGKKIAKKEIEIISIVGEMSLDQLPLKQKMITRVQTQKFVGEPAEIMPSPPYESDRDEDEITLPSIKDSDPERLARVIINDVILYKQKEVDEGRKNRSLYKPLENTILLAREQYLLKFSDLSIFERQLIATLAKGDKEALKGYKFETL